MQSKKRAPYLPELVRGRFGERQLGPAFGEFSGCTDTPAILGILDGAPKTKERIDLARRGRLALEGRTP